MKQTERRRGRRRLAASLTAVILSAALALSGLPAGAVQTASTTDALNLRSGPGSSYGILEVMPSGTAVTVLEDDGSGWVQVRSASGQEGYCSREYLALGGGGSAAGAVAPGGAAVTTDVLNLRSGPGSSYSVLLVLAKGAQLTVLENDGSGWVKVRTQSGYEGYCSGEYLAAGTSGSTGGSSSGGSSSGGSTSGDAEEPQGVLTLDTRSYTMPPDGIYDFRASLTGNLKAEDLKVMSSRTGIATVQQISGTDKYRITAVSPGTCYVTAEIAGRHASIRIDVAEGVTPSGDSQRSVTLIGGAEAPEETGPSGGGSSSGGSTGGNTEEPQGVLTLDTRAYTMPPDGIYDFRASLTGNLKREDLKVTSSRTGIATVQQISGTDKYRITAVSPGVCWVEASIAGRHASIRVDVVEGVTPSGDSQRSVTVIGPDSSGGSSTAPAVLTLDRTSYQFSGPGETCRVTVSGAGDTAPTAASSQTGVASVEYSGVGGAGSYVYEITANGAGSATISFTSGNTTAHMAVTVESGGSGTPAYTSARATTAVNLRGGPGTEYEILTTLATGTVVTVLSTGNPEWTQVRTASGLTGYLSTEYIQFLEEGEAAGAGVVALSHTSGTVPQGKTFLIQTTQAPAGGVTWSSSDPDVATVTNGYIYAVSPGTATITASDAGGANTAACRVTVTQAEPVKAAYTSPNIAGTGASVELVAVTDHTRDAVRFVVEQADGSAQTIQVTQYTEETAENDGLAPNRTRVWRASTSFSAPGTYTVKVYSAQNGVMSSTGAETTSFVVSSQSFTETTAEERRVSDQMLRIMCKWEGFSGAVYPDTLAYNIPTIGYGQTYRAGDVFYNNITETEGWALLLNTVNEIYTGEVNRFIANNRLLVNQQQFDAMISFSHNVGTAYWNGTAAFDAREILLNAVVPPEIPQGGSLPAKTTAAADLYSQPDRSSPVQGELMQGLAVEVLSADFSAAANDGWYQVRTAAGAMGWVRSGYVRFDQASSMTHDLNYADAWAFGSEWLAWHHAGGNCWAGLVYRRLGEAKIFSYGNYEEADPASPLRKHNTYGYEYPDCAKQFEA